MVATALASALLATLLTKIGEQSIEKVADGVVAQTFDRSKSVLEKKLKRGGPTAVQRALQGARDDLLAHCNTTEQRQQVERSLATLFAAQAGPLLEAFSAQVSQIYLQPTPAPAETTALAQTYRKMAGPAALLPGDC